MKTPNDYALDDFDIAALNRIAAKLHALASDRGWHDKPREKGTMIALMHSELSEALEGIRKDKADEHLPEYKSETVELADTMIRILDYCVFHKLDVANALADKHLYNATRSDHSREERAKEGGKAF